MPRCFTIPLMASAFALGTYFLTSADQSCVISHLRASHSQTDDPHHDHTQVPHASASEEQGEHKDGALTGRLLFESKCETALLRLRLALGGGQQILRGGEQSRLRRQGLD